MIRTETDLKIPFAQTRAEREMLAAMRSVPGWLSDEVALLLYRLAHSGPHGLNIVEIGSWKGKSTVALAHALRDTAQKGPRRVLAVDPHTGSQEHRSSESSALNTYPEFLAQLTRLFVQHWVEPYVMSSIRAAQQVAGPIGGIFIDGSHEYPDVHLDFALWFAKLAPGGWIAFHDSKWPGVRQVLWSEFYPHPLAGMIRRVEDTTFARKLRNPSRVARLWNQYMLNYYQQRHQMKRALRKYRKRRRVRG